MQNLDQTQIFYHLGQIHLTWTEHDLVDPDDVEDLDDMADPNGFNPNIYIYIYI